MDEQPPSKDLSPPFTVARYGSLAAAITAERDWQHLEIERLKRQVEELSIHAEKWVKRALGGATPEPCQECEKRKHANDRINYETTEDGFRICRGYHHRSADCEWEYYVRRPAQPPGEGQ
jgi:hypothetical protein